MTKLFGQKESSAPLDDPTALAQFGKLEVVARLVVEGYIMGQHKSPYKGASVEFVEHRQYYPGDEIRHIDWRAYGKTGKYYIKEFEDETNLRCNMIVDGSGSMRYGESTISKFDYARQLAAALGFLLLGQRDAVGLTTFDTEIRERLTPSTSPTAFRRIISTLDKFKPGRETSMSKVFDKLLPTIKRRSLVVIMSDCFDDIDALMSSLEHFRHSRHEVLLFQILAPEEEEFPFRHPTQFRNLEKQGNHRLVDPHRLRTHYLKQFSKFCTNLEKGCGRIGIDYQKFSTADPYHRALGAFLASRTRRKGKRWV
jgi:uncharacterized protein (DUF58 family)